MLSCNVKGFEGTRGFKIDTIVKNDTKFFFVHFKM